jgi:hypothetical protein
MQEHIAVLSRGRMDENQPTASAASAARGLALLSTVSYGLKLEQRQYLSSV